jgi:hypothetical protein
MNLEYVEVLPNIVHAACGAGFFDYCHDQFVNDDGAMAFYDFPPWSAIHNR